MPLKIAMLHYHGGGIGDWRHWIPARALQRRGHEVWFSENDGSCLTPYKEPWQFLREQLIWADVVHCGYTPDTDFSRWMATARNTALKGLNKQLPLLVDCDDDIENVPPYNIAYGGYGASKDYKRAALFNLKVADSVTVTTPYLKNLYTSVSRNIAILPNSIHPPDWQHPVDPQRADSADVRIVFSGNLGRKGDIDLVQDALESVMRQRPQARLFFVGMMPDWAMQWCQSTSDPTANRVFFIQPSKPELYRRIMCWMGFDIVITPVQSNEFNRGKSNIKVLESALYGAAALCSDWETYADAPTEAVLRADTTYEWRESLLALIDDSTLRRRKVAACRQWVLDTQTIDSRASLWENAYEDALSRPVIGDDGENMVAGTEALRVDGTRIVAP